MRPFAVRRWAPVALAAGLALATGCSGSSRPSVILVTLDTTRADRFGAYGGTAVPTPAFDGLAEAGVLFETAVSQVPLTLPSHSTILTGRYPATHGVRHNGIYRLPDGETTLAERFRDAGYATAAFVGAYVLNAEFGTGQGFDLYDDIPANRFEGGRDRIYEAERTADEVNERVFAWLEERPREPVFLWVHYFDPHAPYAPPEGTGRTLHGAGYDREISYMDACLGDLLERLRDRGLLEGSVLVVAGDHSEGLDQHGESTHGILLYDEAVRVPLVIRAPGRLAAGARVAAPVELVDFAPTVAALAGLPPLPGWQGRDLAPLVAGESSGLEHVAFAESLMGRLEYGWSEIYMARDARFKFVDAPRPELYDLKNDPGETRNLAAEDPERARSMAATVRDWLASAARESDGEGAARALSAEEEARLRSLGYLGGDSFREEPADGEEAEARPDPKDMLPEARKVQAAEERFAAGELEEALAAVEGLLAVNPRNQKARALRVKSLAVLGRLSDAEEEARAGVSLASSSAATPGVILEENLGLLASTLRMQGEIAEAESIYREILERNPANEPAGADLARLLLDAGRPDAALETAAALLARNPTHASALSTRFLAETELRLDDAALATAERLSEAHAGEPDVLVRAGDRLLAAGRPGAAASCFDSALAQRGFHPELAGKLGEAQLNAGMSDAAERTFRWMAENLPADARPRFYLGKLALRRDDEEGARRWFDEALERNPGFALPHVTLAQWLASKGRRDEAIEASREAVRRNPGDARAREVLERLEKD